MMDNLDALSLEDAQGMAALVQKVIAKAKANSAHASDIAELEKTLAMLNRKIASLTN